MAINKKLIYYNRTLANFKSDANGLNGQTTASGGNVGNIPYASIVFTSDGYIWTHGKEFNCNNTWRGIQNNLTSTSTTDSLSAYQGKILNEKFANYLPLSGGTLTGALTVPSLTVTGASTFSQAINGSILGNAATASRLLNARTITIGNLSNSFDGSANISYSLASMGAFASSSFTLANIKSTLGISDWALAGSKPSYNLDEISDGTTYHRKYPYGFNGQQNNNNWLGVSGLTLLTAWQDTTRGGEVGFWTNGSGQMYVAVDGFFYLRRDFNSVSKAQRVLDEYDISHTKWGDADTLDSLNSSDFVQIAGTQTISGNKTFSGSTSIDDATIGNLVVTGGASFALTINGTIDKALKDGSGNTITSTYVKKSGDTMTGLLTTTTGNNHNGIKVGNTYINSINGELILLNNTSIRFGGDSWDYNVWAGLKYVHSSKIVYLGLADGSAFTANSALSGGKLYTPGISNIYIGNGTLTVYHTGNLSIGTLMGSTAIGDADEPVYWSGSAFVKAGAYPTKASWNYDDVYLPLTGANYNTNTDANPFIISRTGGTAEALAISLNDSRTLFKYTNDEASNSIIFQLVNTDTERASNKGADASDHSVTITSDKNGIYMYVGGSTVYHTGNLSPMTTSHAANGITSTNITNWNSVYTWYTTAAGTSASGVIDNWNEIKNFIDGFHESDDLAEYLVNTFVAKTGGTMTGALTTPSLTVTGAAIFSLAINGSILGNAATASRLQNARTISLTGSVTGSGSFDGSGNLSIATTTNHSHSYVNTIGISGSKLTWSINGTALTAIQLPTYTNNVTSHLRAGAQNGTANSTSATSDPYLLLVEGSTLDSLIQLKASTGISISANGGVITITNTSPDVNHNTHTYTSTWTSVTGNNAYPIAISPNATPATSGNGYNANFTFNPSTKTFNNNGCRLQYDSTNKVLKFLFD